MNYRGKVSCYMTACNWRDDLYYEDVDEDTASSLANVMWQAHAAMCHPMITPSTFKVSMS